MCAWGCVCSQDLPHAACFLLPVDGNDGVGMCPPLALAALPACCTLKLPDRFKFCGISGRGSASGSTPEACQPPHTQTHTHTHLNTFFHFLFHFHRPNEKLHTREFDFNMREINTMALTAQLTQAEAEAAAARQRSDSKGSAADTLIGPVLNTWRVSIMI